MTNPDRGSRPPAADDCAITTESRVPRILIYSMYDPGRPDRAGNVRSRLLADAMMREARVVLISGGRRARAFGALSWIAREGPRSIDAAYVESASSFASPADLAFLLVLRLASRPVGVYFRDAYQEFRDLYPITSGKDQLLDILWHLSTPILKRLSTVQFAPTAALARVLSLKRLTLLPPGTDSAAPNLGAGSGDIVGYVGAVGLPDGVDLLVEAMRTVRGTKPDASLIVVTGGELERTVSPVPPWVTVLRKGRTDLPEILRDVAVCTIPRRINRYNDLAVPVKLMDYLSYGKPVVATRCEAIAALLGPTDAAILVADSSEEIAAGILRILSNRNEGSRLAERARALAVDPEWTWDARARTIISVLVPAAPSPVGRR